MRTVGLSKQIPTAEQVAALKAVYEAKRRNSMGREAAWAVYRAAKHQLDQQTEREGERGQ